MYNTRIWFVCNVYLTILIIIILLYHYFWVLQSFTYKELITRFRQPIPEVKPVEPLPERCFYENHTKKILKLCKACRENSTLHVCQQVSQYCVDTNILVNFDLVT